MKYFAYATFTHNSVKINGGDVFESVDVKFSQSDIDFLKTFQKIRPVYENKSETKKVLKEKVSIEKVAHQVAPQVIEDVKSEEPETDLSKLKRGELLKYASSLGIKSANKLSNKEVIEKIEEIRNN